MPEQTSHLVSLGRSGWSLWRWLWLRGAGFPARDILALGSSALVEHLDTLDLADDRPRADTLELVQREAARIDGVLRSIASSSLFREAVTWQNREARQNSIDAYLRSPPKDNTRVRERRRVVAKYFQRYAMKNETIGFFGPSVWGEIDADRTIDLVPHPAFLAERRLSFENWAIEALAQLLSDRRELRPLFVPRRKPFSRLDGTTLHIPPAPSRQLGPADAQLLARVDGGTRARQIADAVGGDPELVYDALERLGRQGLISWALEIPADLEAPERWLRSELEQLEDGEARARALEPLDRLEAARTEVARAAGDPDALDTAIDRLEREFAEITAMAVKRGHGQAYAGRQLFYEDCTRAVDARLGGRILEDLDGPLSLVLQSARWFTYEVARKFHESALALHRDHVAGGGDPRMPFGTLLVAARNIFTGDQYRISPFVAEVQEELHRRWEAVLGVERAPADAHVLALRAEDLAPAVHAAFDAPGPGWPRARHHAPDILIAARDAAAIARGEYRVVLGELHCGTNTLFARAAYRLHPDREAMKAAWEADLGTGLVQPTQGSADRSTHLPVSDHDFHLEVNWARSWRPREGVLAAGAFVVEEVAGRLLVRSLDGTREYDLVAFCEHYLCAAVAPHFSLLPHRAHTPRIEIDRLVITRERWEMPASALPDVVAGSAFDVVERTARWARRIGLPRFAFVRVPTERKPLYIDFASPVLLDVLARLLRDAPKLAVSELYPGHDELWLVDGQQNHYTSELRVAAVDPRPWSR